MTASRITRGPAAEYDELTQRQIIARCSGPAPVVIAGETLLAAVGLRLEYIAGQHWIHADPPDMRPSKQCDHCHRFDVKERIATSWDEAIEFGWIIPIEEVPR